MSERIVQLEKDRKKLYAKRDYSAKMLTVLSDQPASLRRDRAIKAHRENIGGYEIDLEWIANELENAAKRRERSYRLADDYRSEIRMVQNTIKNQTHSYESGLKDIQEMPPIERAEVITAGRRITKLQRMLKLLLDRQAVRERQQDLLYKEKAKNYRNKPTAQDKLDAAELARLEHVKPLTGLFNDADMQEIFKQAQREKDLTATNAEL